MRDTVGNRPEGGDGSLRFVCQHLQGYLGEEKLLDFYIR